MQQAGRQRRLGADHAVGRWRAEAAQPERSRMGCFPQRLDAGIEKIGLAGQNLLSQLDVVRDFRSPGCLQCDLGPLPYWADQLAQPIGLLAQVFELLEQWHANRIRRSIIGQSVDLLAFGLPHPQYGLRIEQLVQDLPLGIGDDTVDRSAGELDRLTVVTRRSVRLATRARPPRPGPWTPRENTERDSHHDQRQHKPFHAKPLHGKSPTRSSRRWRAGSGPSYSWPDRCTGRR